jgi:hypothetical protein
MLAGGLNSVAGGGSFIGLPALAFLAGIPTKLANTTNSVALWPGALSSAFAYRAHLRPTARVTLLFSAISLIGGILGALILLNTSQATFARILPGLMLFATLLLIFGGELTKRLRRAPTAQPGAPDHWRELLLFGALHLMVATYGGYFGGGQGIMMLAVFSVMGMTDIHEMNGLKAWLATLTNGASNITFMLFGAVAWPSMIVMTLGAILGGYLGAHYAQRLPAQWVKRFVMVVAVVMTVYFFARG